MGLQRTARVGLGAIVLAGALLSGCGDDEPAGDDPASDDGSATTGAAGIPAPGVVTPAQAAALTEVDSVTVIDVRTPEEYDEGHLADAVLVDLSSGRFADEIAQLDRDGEYLVYCRSDSRSGQAVAIMEDLGFERVWDLDGGIVAWADAGLPVAT